MVLEQGAVLAQIDWGAVVFAGLQRGAIFALLGLGLTIILGTMEFLNLAHGALYAVGVYVGLFVASTSELGDGILAGLVSNPEVFGLGADFTVALILTPLVLFVIGVAMERFIARPLYDASEVQQLLITFGLALIVQELIKVSFGPQPYAKYAPSTLLGINVEGSVALPLLGSVVRWRLAIVLITFLVIGLTYYIVEQTDFGLVVQAGTEDSEMVRLLGIKITRSYAIIFGLGAALAGLAGLVGGSIINPEPGIGTQEALVPAFLTVVVGGAGSVVGAIAGGLLLGLIVGFFEITAPAWSAIALYAFVAVFILVRPEGLFGSTEVGS